MNNLIIKKVKSKNKNLSNVRAFSLIELLAVIVILAIVALVVTPLVLNIIDNIKKEAFRAAVQGIVKSAETNYYQDMLKEKV